VSLDMQTAGLQSEGATQKTQEEDE